MQEQTHKAIVQWGPSQITAEKQDQIEQAIKALIEVLDYTEVESITFSKIENDGQENKDESGSADGANQG